MKSHTLKGKDTMVKERKHTTHYACKEIMDKYGGKAKGCCCTLHECKPPENENGWEKERARLIYEATRIEAEWSERSIVPEQWKRRDEKFKKQFVNIINKYLLKEKLPTPEEAHQSWMDSYFKMGWKYGKKRNIIKRTHPDLLPFNELPKDERDKDAIFLVFVWLMKNIISQSHTQYVKELEGKIEKLRQKGDPTGFGFTSAVAVNRVIDRVLSLLKDLKVQKGEI